MNHKLTQEEQEIIDRCVRYYETDGRFMPGHRLMIIVGKLVSQLINISGERYNYQYLLQEVLRETDRDMGSSISLELSMRIRKILKGKA